MANETPEIDVAKIQAEVNALSPEEIEKQLTALRTKQKVQQKKNYGSVTQKAYQAKQRERRKLLKAKAIELGLYDKINQEAERLADEKLAEDAVSEENDD